MKTNQPTVSLKLILGSVTGMALGFVVFLITQNFIFLIVFTTIGLTLGIALAAPDNNSEDAGE